MDSKEDNQIRDWSTALLWPALAILLLAKLWFTYTRYLNQDEFETLHQGWLIFSGSIQFRDFNSNHPPLAFSIVALLNYLTNDPVVLVILGRTLTLVSSLICLIFIHGIARCLFNSSAARWAVIGYALNATFWEWSIEIRTDFAMVMFWLGGIFLFVSAGKQPKFWQTTLCGIFFGLAFWSNQKVAAMVLPVAVWMFTGGVDGNWRLKHTFFAVLASLVCCGFYLGVAFYSGSLSHMFAHNFDGALSLIAEGDYADAKILSVRHALMVDPLFVLLGIGGAFWAVFSDDRNRKSVFAGISAFWMLPNLFFTPSAYQYFLTSIFPMFAITFGGWMDRLARTWLSRIPYHVHPKLVAAGMIGLMICPLIRFSKFINPSLGYQLEVVRLVDEITDETAKVFDGAGTQLTRHDAYPFHWVLWKGELNRYSRNEMPRILPELIQNRCDLVIDTYRVLKLPEDEKIQIREKFPVWWGPIRVPGFDSFLPIGQTPVEFELIHGGIYVTDQSDLVIDGRPWKSGGFLNRGRHTIAHHSNLQTRIQLRKKTRIDYRLSHLKPALRQHYLEPLGYQY